MEILRIGDTYKAQDRKGKEKAKRSCERVQIIDQRLNFLTANIRIY